jgi:hypothetical protein
MDLMDAFDLARYQPALREYFEALPDVTLAYLFGSQARGQAWAKSDVDIAVLLAGRPDDERCLDVRLEIIGGLMDLLTINEVDVLILNQAPPALRYAVLRDGILLFCRDDQVRIRFYVRVLNAYLDFKPVLARHRQAFLERARKGALDDGWDREPPRPDPEVLARFARLSTDDV